MSNTPPTVNHNFPIGGDAGTLGDVEISPFVLDYDDLEQSDTEITYTISSVSLYGSLLKNGITLGLGDSFTQDDINNHRVAFSSFFSGTVSDQIGFVVSDGVGGQISGALHFAIVDNTVHPPDIAIAASATYVEGQPATV